jgi:hypothetical protein
MIARGASSSAPSGSFARRLPQFRSGYPDPVGDYYRRLAAKELSNQ